MPSIWNTRNIAFEGSDPNVKYITAFDDRPREGEERLREASRFTYISRSRQQPFRRCCIESG